jgi:hypothetical protein
LVVPAREGGDDEDKEEEEEEEAGVIEGSISSLKQPPPLAPALIPAPGIDATGAAAAVSTDFLFRRAREGPPIDLCFAGGKLPRKSFKEAPPSDGVVVMIRMGNKVEEEKEEVEEEPRVCDGSDDVLDDTQLLSVTFMLLNTLPVARRPVKGVAGGAPFVGAAAAADDDDEATGCSEDPPKEGVGVGVACWASASFWRFTFCENLDVRPGCKPLPPEADPTRALAEITRLPPPSPPSVSLSLLAELAPPCVDIFGPRP